MSTGMPAIKGYFEAPAAKDRLMSLVPRGVEPARLMRMAMLSIAKTPKLQECTPESLFMAVCDAAALGLDCGGSLGTAYLVPYKDKCQLIVGYRGMVQLARKSGEILTVQAAVVRNGDEFEFEYGTTPTFRHKPADACDDADITRAWACAKFKDGSFQIDVMTRSEIEKVRARSKASGSGPWITDYAEMCKKTVVRRLCKMLPMTPEAAEAIDKSDRMEIDLNAPTTATFAPPRTALSPRPTMQRELAETITKAVDTEVIDEPGANDGFEDLSNPPADFIDPKSGNSTSLIEDTITPAYLNSRKRNEDGKFADKKPNSIKTKDGLYYSVYSETAWEQVTAIGKQPMVVGYEMDGDFKTVKEVRKA